jgi:peroxiredoxin
MRISSNQLLIQVATTPYETIVLTATSSASLPNDTFCNILVSCDMANAANRYIYINDVADSVTWSVYANLNIPFTGGAGGVGFGIGATASGGANYKGRISGLYLDYTYRDLSIEANRRLFIDDDGLYVTPPTTGIISIPMDDPADPGRNDGTGGNFTLSGVVARSGRGPNQYNAVYSDFDGSNDFLSRTTNVTGIADSKLVTVHFIVKGDDFSLTPNIILFSDGAGAPKFYAVVTSAGKLQLVAWNAANSIILNAITTTTLYVGKNYSIEVSIDLSDTGKRYIYINGEAAGVTWTTYTDDSIDFTLASPRVRIGCDRNTTPSAFWNGSIGDVYFDTQYIDLSTSNPFYDTDTDKPKFLGATGNLPTGSAPLVYLPMYGTSAGTNLGTGGDFTVNSGPYVGARGPSEFWADSAEFNGTTQYLSKASALTGAVDGKVFSFAVALKPDTLSGTHYLLNLSAAGQRFAIFQTNDKVRIVGINSGGTTIFDAVTTSTTLITNWKMLLIGINLANAGDRYIYSNNIEQTVTWTTYTDDSIEFSAGTALTVGATPTPSFHSSMAESAFSGLTRVTSTSAKKQTASSSLMRLTIPLILVQMGQYPQAVNHLFI